MLDGLENQECYREQIKLASKYSVRGTYSDIVDRTRRPLRLFYVFDEIII